MTPALGRAFMGSGLGPAGLHRGVVALGGVPDQCCGKLAGGVECVGGGMFYPSGLRPVRRAEETC